MVRRDEEIRKYFEALDRSLFMEEYRDQAGVDSAFPIGYGQTISQPSLVLSMTCALEPKDDSRILEIGTGSGYQSALLAAFCRALYTVERIAPLQEKARRRLREMGYRNIRFRVGDGSQGWAAHAPYDRIMVTAAAARIPPPLADQLAPGGRMVIPVGPPDVQKLLLVEKGPDGELGSSLLGRVRFVRFVGAD